jgi:asparagine synthase (glutamine-hydrolysing)
MLGEVLALRVNHLTETIWKNIYRLLPGSALTIQPHGTPKIWQWHQGPFNEIKFRKDEEYTDRFKELFDQALKSCLRSSTPVFVQLSGGVDSSSVVCRSAELYKKGQVDKLVQPISAVFPGGTHDESNWIDMVAEKTGIQSKRSTPGKYCWQEHIAWAKERSHLPLRPNANLMESLAAKLPENGSRVMLTGEGGDDWLVGSFSHFPDLMRQGRVIQLLREGLILNNHGNYWDKIRRTAGNGLGPWLKPQLKKMAMYGSEYTEDIPKWINPEWSAKIGLKERVEPVHNILGLRSLSQIRRYPRYLAVKHHIIFDNAYHRMSSYNIEIRHPFHDRRLTEFVMACPGRMLRQGERKKFVLREAMKGTLPEGIRNRTTKAAFFDPYVEAMAEYLVDHPVQELAPVKNGWIDGNMMISIFDKNREAKKRGLKDGVHPPSLGPLWFAMSIDVWMRNSFSL